MGSKPATPSTKRPVPNNQPRGGRKGVRSLNRSEQQAMRVRAAATAAATAAAEADDAPSPGSRPADASALNRMRRTAAARSQAVGRVVTLSRDQEYAIIRGDLRRLLLIASVLLVLMIALLLVLPR